MAVDKLVDSTQLDADLTSVANAIRTKGGTSAQMEFPAGFVSAVNAIPTGGGIKVLQVTNGHSNSYGFSLRGVVDSPLDEIVFDCSGSTALNGFGYSAIKGTPKLTFINTTGVTSSIDFLRQGFTFSEVDFGHFAPTTLTRFMYQLNYYTVFPDGTLPIPETFLGYNLDLSNLTSGGVNPNAGSLTSEITLLFEGTLHIDMTFNATQLTVASIISLINCLEDLSGTDTTHTLTLGANKNRLTEEQIKVATDKGWTVA